MKRVFKTTSWLALLAASALVYAAPPTQKELEARLDEVFKPWDKKDAPGGSVYVSVKGKVVYQKAFGMANLENNVPNTLETVFDVGSVSKQFTAACVMLLQDDGKLKIDDLAGDHLPEYPVLRANKITVRQMLSHTAGLRDYMALMAFSTGTFAFEDKDVVDVLKGQSTLNFAPNTSWDYSNSGFYLAKKLVEKISGKSLAEFAKERLFDPLGMKHTRFLDDASKLIPGRAFGYIDLGDGEGYRAGVTVVAADGAGGLWTTLDDMHKWVQNWKNNKLGSDPKMFEHMQQKSKIALGREVPYGLAFFADEYKGVRRIQHGGDFIGFHSFVGWYPDQDVVVFTMSNDGTQNAKTLNDKAAEVVLGEAIKKDESEPTEDLVLTEEELEPYVGKFDMAGRIVDITRTGKQLYVQVTGQPKFEIYPSKKDEFYFKVVEARLVFAWTEDKKIESVTLYQGGAVIKCLPAKPYEMSAERQDALVGIYYSSEFDMILRVRKEKDGLYGYSRTLLDELKLEPASDKKLSAGPLTIDVDEEDGAVKALRVTMPRASNMKFVRLSSSLD